MDELEEILPDITSSRIRKKIDSTIGKLSHRNKLIKIADRSPGGWGTIDEYLSDELASDSDDEKRIRDAENRALRKKNRKILPRSSSTITRPRHYSQSSSSTQNNDRTLSGRHYSQGSFNQNQYHQNHQRNYQQANHQISRNACFLCGQAGHWRSQCPNLQPQAYGKGSTNFTSTFPQQQG